ncbi:hypothetical protein ABIB40_002796 [Pedobacter sp. UYP30]|uniref:hypothetical protein n=1 Tax=Pedobacter sp. UYP30 TaxID=1756400 RepID=UPI003394AF89
MKTDLVEIFQTLRASLYSYQTRGYTVHKDSDTAYELYSEKNRDANGQKITEFFFTGLYVEDGKVMLKFNATDFKPSDNDLIVFDDQTKGFALVDLDEQKQQEIIAFVEIVHAHFKKNEWV